MKNRLKIHDDWETPEWLLQELKEEFGKLFDPCPIRSSFNGLEIEWKNTNYINPPYNRKDKELFIRKAFVESKKGKLCILLLPVSTSTKIFHEVIYQNAEIRFFRKRIKFKGVNGKGDLVSNGQPQHDSMLVIFRPEK